MIKVIVRLPKKPGISNEDFEKYWREKHGPLCVRILPGLRKYNQNHIVKGSGVEDAGFGIAEIYFDDLEAYNRFMKWRHSEEAKELLNDENKFLDGPNVVVYGVFEEVKIL